MTDTSINMADTIAMIMILIGPFVLGVVVLVINYLHGDDNKPRNSSEKDNEDGSNNY